MSIAQLHAVTGAFGYSGSYITRLLLDRGDHVRALTNHPGDPQRFGGRVQIGSLDFDQPSKLAQNLEGASTLFNTYWIRFPYRGIDFDRAVNNIKVLFDAARAAQVRRIVHISITGASAAPDLPYFHGKGLVEEALIASGLSYAILRPALIYGPEDILLNNIAWLLRRFPLFTIPGSGEYRLQPVFVEDLARLAIEASDRRDNYIVDAVGPETYTFNGLAESIKRAIGSSAIIVHVPPAVARVLAMIIGRMTGDITLTEDEVKGLMANLLVSHSRPTAPDRLSVWIHQNAADLGRRYVSEIARRR
ncbi:MAG TPA: NAD(P)H-binding protein [Candidatus Binataceae bacterium]|nr:NAD(P)H-binding protein [Candidatus Binataceae bacterium]